METENQPEQTNQEEKKEDSFDDIPDEDVPQAETDESFEGPQVEENEKVESAVLLIAAQTLNNENVRRKVNDAAESDSTTSKFVKTGTMVGDKINSGGTYISDLIRKRTEEVHKSTLEQSSSGDSKMEETKVETKYKVAATGTDATLHGMSKVADTTSSLWQRCVDGVGKYTSKQLYSKYPNFMKNPITIKVKTILLAILSFIVNIIGAVFNFVDNIVYAGIDYIAAQVGKRKGQDLEKLVKNILSISVSVFKIALSISLMGLKGTIVSFIILFIVNVLVEIVEPVEEEEKKEASAPSAEKKEEAPEKKEEAPEKKDDNSPPPDLE